MSFPDYLSGCANPIIVIGAGYVDQYPLFGIGKQIKQQERTLVEDAKAFNVEQDKWSSRTAPINLERALHIMV